MNPWISFLIGVVCGGFSFGGLITLIFVKNIKATEMYIRKIKDSTLSDSFNKLLEPEKKKRFQWLRRKK